MRLMAAVALFLLVGCGADGLSRGIYEGARQQGASRDDPQAPRPAEPSFDAYEQERQRLKSDPAQ